MNFKKMGQQLATNVAKMPVRSPDGDEIYLIKTEGGYEATTDNTDPEVEYLPSELHVVGKYSARFKARQAKVSADMVKRMRDKKVKITAGTVEENERSTTETLATTIVGWANILWEDADGNDALLDFTNENAIMLLEEYPPLRAQVDEYVGDDANFMKKG